MVIFVLIVVIGLTTYAAGIAQAVWFIRNRPDRAQQIFEAIDARQARKEQAAHGHDLPGHSHGHATQCSHDTARQHQPGTGLPAVSPPPAVDPWL